jgi:hypothetical protein
LVKQSGSPVLEKLDNILVTKEWEDIFPQACVNKLPREISDHNPLVLTTRKCDNLPHIQFKCDLCWLKNPEFFVLVEKIWKKPCKAERQLIRFNKNSSYLNNILRVGGLTCKEK